MNFIKVIINIQMTRIKLQIKIYQDPIYIPPRLILNVDANIIKKHRKTKYCLVECNFASVLKTFHDQKHTKANPAMNWLDLKERNASAYRARGCETQATARTRIRRSFSLAVTHNSPKPRQGGINRHGYKLGLQLCN